MADWFGWERQREREKNNQIKEEVRERGRACSLSHLIDLTLIQRGRYMTHQRQIHISFPLSMEVLLSPLYIHSNTRTECETLLSVLHTRTHRPNPSPSLPPPSSLSPSVLSEVAAPNKPFGLGTALTKSFTSCGPCQELGRLSLSLSLISCEIIG